MSRKWFIAIVSSLCAALGLLWWIGDPLPRFAESIWLATHRGAAIAVVWLVAGAGLASAALAWFGPRAMRARLALAWFVVALVALLALRPQAMAIVRALLR
ncbi:MAG: hypothetical protein U0575_02545 [Phycisphaerales bacterium]